MRWAVDMKYISILPLNDCLHIPAPSDKTHSNLRGVVQKKGTTGRKGKRDKREKGRKLEKRDRAKREKGSKRQKGDREGGRGCHPIWRPSHLQC